MIWKKFQPDWENMADEGNFMTLKSTLGVAFLACAKAIPAAPLIRFMRLFTVLLFMSVIFGGGQPVFAANGLGNVNVFITCNPSPLPGGIPNGWWYELWYNDPGIGWAKSTYGNYSQTVSFQKSAWANQAIEFKLILVFGDYWNTYEYYAVSAAGSTDISFPVKPHATMTGYVSPQSAIDAGAKWRFTTGSDTGWKNNAQTVEIALTTCPESRTIEFSSVPGWNTPSSRVVSFVQEDGKSTSGTYTMIVPAAPSGITASDGTFSNKVVISWTTSSWATAYDVWRCTSNASGAATCIASNIPTSKYDDASAPFGIMLYYWVKAKNSGGISSFSASDTGFKFAVIPDPPINVAASDATYTGRVNIAWNSSAGAVEYEVWRNTTNLSVFASQIADHLAVTSFDDATAGLGQLYYYWVKAKNVAGVSTFSLSNSGCKQLVAPNGVVASDGLYDDKVLVNWSSLNSNVCYEVWRNTVMATNTAVLQAVVAESFYADTNTVAGSGYYYWVRATNDVAGVSVFSVLDRGFRNLSAPSGVGASLASYTDRVEIVWSGNLDATSYNVLRGTSSNVNLAISVGGTTATNFFDLSAVPGVTYFFWLTAQNAFITSSVSPYAVGRAAAIPPSPVGVSASDGVYTNFIHVSWSASLDAVKYHIYRSTNSAPGTAAEIAETTLLSYSDLTPIRGATYYYWVKAENMAGISDFSSSDTGRIMNLPVPPLGLNASDGTYGDRVVVQWSVAVDASSYEIWKNTENNPGGAVLLTEISGNSYPDTNVAPSVMNYYWVRSKNALGISVLSGVDSGFVPGIPSAPTFVSASDGTAEDYVRVLWTSVSGASRYDVWRNSVNNTNTASLIGQATTNVYKDGTLIPGSIAYYWVKASNLAGIGGFSSPDIGFSGIAKPAVLLASDGTSTNRVTLVWNASRGATSYDVFRNTTNDAGTSQLLGSPSITNYIDSTCDPSVLYFYWVRANNGLSTGDLSLPDSGYLSLMPPVFRSVGADGAAAKIELSWTPVPGASAYEVSRASSNIIAEASPVAVITTTNLLDASVDAQTRYYYWVRAENANTTSEWSSVCSAFLLNAPTEVSASDGILGDSVSVGWLPANHATSYEIWRSFDGNPTSSVMVAEVMSPAYIDTNVAAFLVYHYWVKSKNSVGTSSLSDSDQGFIAGTPEVPFTLAASKGIVEDAVRVEWSPSDVATRYEIWRNSLNDTNGASQIGLVTTNVYSDMSLIPGSIAYYWVRAFNLSGGSSFSISDFGYSGLSKPKSLQASDGASTDRVTLVWGAPRGADSYDILRSTTNDVGWAQVLGESATTNFVDTTCDPSLYYYYWVRAKNNLSVGEPSDSDDGYLALTQPVWSSVSAGSFTGRIELAWLTVTGAASYDVWRAVSNDISLATQIASTGVTFMADRAVNAQTRYYYWLRARNSQAISPWSPAGAGFLLTAPTGVVAADGTDTSGVYVVWNPVAGAIAYDILRNTNDVSGVASVVGSTTSTNFMDSTALAGPFYFYWIKAISACDTSSVSTSDSGFVRLASPGGVSASQGSYTDRVVVAWASCPGADYCEIWRHTEDNLGFAENMGQTSSNAFVDISATAGISYYYWVRPYNSHSIGEVSQSVQGYAVAPPVPPFIVTASAGSVLGRIDVDWSPSVGASGYEVWRSTTPSTSGATKIAEVTINGHSDTNVIVGRLYYYWVKTRNTFGVSGFSGLAVGFSAVPIPSALTASDGLFLTHVQIDWEVVSGATAYELWRNTNDNIGGASLLVQVNTNFYQDTNAAPGIVYSYWVRAKTTFSDSDFSVADTGSVAAVFAVRSIVGTNVTIRVTVSPMVQCFALEEALPVGVAPVGITGSGVWDVNNRKVKWGPFLVPVDVELQYSITGNPGDYIVGGEVSCDGAVASISGGAAVQIPNSFSIWQHSVFGAAATNESTSGRAADPDGDGVPNIFEYAFGMNPNLNSREGLPRYSLQRGPTNCFLVIEFTRVRSAVDLDYNVEVTESLMSSWHSGNPFTEIVSVSYNDDGTETVRVRDLGIPTANGCRFIRLAIGTQ